MASASACSPEVSRIFPLPTVETCFPNEGETVRILSTWDPHIRRAARSTERSYDTRSAETADFAQEARIRVLRVLHRAPDASEPFVRRVISNAVRKSANRELPHLVERLDAMSADGDVQNDESTRDFEDNRYRPDNSPDVYEIRAVDAWISSLPDQLRRVYELLYVEDLNQREAALKLQVSQPRVTQLHAELLRRGRKALVRLAA